MCIHIMYLIIIDYFNLPDLIPDLKIIELMVILIRLG